MTIVTGGLGGASLMVTRGFGFKDAITEIIEQSQEFGGKNKKRKRTAADLSFLRDTFTIPVDQTRKAIDELDGLGSGSELHGSLEIGNFLQDKVIDFDGHDYQIMPRPDDIHRLIDKAHDLDEKINTVQRELDVSRADAKRILFDRAKHEMAASIQHQQAIFEDDMEIIEILLLADEL